MARRSDHSREELLNLALDAARDLAEKEGLRGVTARGVARKIGYTIGTIYNLFKDLDELIVHLNVNTLDRLYEELSSIQLGNGPEKDLLALAQGYLDFTEQHPRLWGVVYEHRLPEGRSRPDWYYPSVFRLYGLIEEAIKPYFSARQKKRRLHTARVIWSAIHGISSLAVSGRFASVETPQGMANTLITNFVGGMSKARAG